MLGGAAHCGWWPGDLQSSADAAQDVNDGPSCEDPALVHLQTQPQVKEDSSKLAVVFCTPLFAIFTCTPLPSLLPFLSSFPSLSSSLPSPFPFSLLSSFLPSSSAPVSPLPTTQILTVTKWTSMFPKAWRPRQRSRRWWWFPEWSSPHSPTVRSWASSRTHLRPPQRWPRETCLLKRCEGVGVRDMYATLITCLCEFVV